MKSCPYCGGRQLVMSPEGNLVCAVCGAVIGYAIEETPPFNHRNAYYTIRRKIKNKILMKNILNNKRVIDPIDPLDNYSYKMILNNKKISLGRKRKTLMALARIARLLAQGYSLESAINEAARRYNVSRHTLDKLARKYRREIAEISERVVESWRRSSINRI